MRSFRLPTAPRKLAAFILAAVLGLSAAPALAQEEPPPPEDKAADWSEAFERGLELLRIKKLDESIKAFEVCIKLFPDRAVAYYNVACAYALKKDPAKCCTWLKKSFERGFLDLAHVGRDTDLDPVRESDAFKELFAAKRKEILDKHPKATVYVPEGEKKRPLVVYIHANGTSPADALERLRPVAKALDAALLIPAATGGAWDSTAETCVAADIAEALADAKVGADPERVVLVGEADGATHALSFALENAAWRRVVAATGAYPKVEAAKAKGLSLYLFAPRSNERALAEAQEARNDALAGGARVRIERHGADQALPKDSAEALERAIRWTLGEQVALPGEGSERKF